MRGEYLARGRGELIDGLFERVEYAAAFGDGGWGDGEVFFVDAAQGAERHRDGGLDGNEMLQKMGRGDG